MSHQRLRGVLLTGALLAAASGCEVTNPGPIQDEFLSEATSQLPLVTGAHRKVSEGLNNLTYHSSVVAREVFPSGETTGGVTPQMAGGDLLEDQVNGVWSDIQQGRFIAEDAIRRFTASGVTVDPNVLAQAYIWAGHANRILGENWCEVTFDGGPKQPGSAAFARAEEHFSAAIGKATTDALRQAAYAGRAQVRLAQKKWAEAASDAAQVPLTFTFQARTDGNEAAMRNAMYWNKANLPYRLYSIHFTTFYDYYTQTGDPRAAWRTNPTVPNATSSLVGFGVVPWSYPTKYATDSAPYTLSSGREMVLIRAEAALAQGQLQAAATLINQIRTSVRSETTNQNLAPYTINTAADAWTALFAERRLELFLEGRRLFDIRRFEQNQNPGTLNLPNFEARSFIFKANFSRCFPISQQERLTNPNLG